MVNVPVQPSETILSVKNRLGSTSEQLASKTLTNASKIVKSYQSTSDMVQAGRWSKIGTLGALFGVLLGITPGLPENWRDARAIASPAIVFVSLELTKKHTRECVKAKKLKRTEDVERFERDKTQIVTKYRPYATPNLIKVGGESRAVANVLNSDQNNLQVEAHGQKTWGTYHRFYFGVVHMSDHANLYKWKDAIKQTLSTNEAVTINWEEGKLCVDVSRPQNECVYPLVRENIGTDRHQILIPKGMNGDRLLFMPFDSQFNGGWVTGMSGSGKSQWAIAAADFLRRRHSNKVVQYSMGEILLGAKTRAFYDADWADDPHLFCPLAQGYVSVIRSLAKIIYECRRRAKLFAEAGVQNVDEYNALGEGEYLPRILYFLDEPETVFDGDLCQPMYRVTLLKMFLIIARMCRSQGAAIIFLPKSVAAGDKDVFPVGLRRTSGSLAICLKALASDGCITLQANEQEEGFAGAVAHLPGRGAGITRENGELIRVQGLLADKLDKSAIVGYGRDEQPDQSLPEFLEVIAEFCAGTMQEDKELEEVLAAEGIDYDTLIAVAEGKLSVGEVREGKKPKQKPGKAEKPVRDYESQRRTYEIYSVLRQSGKSMSNCLVEMTNDAKPNSSQYRSAILAVEEAVKLFGLEWVAQLNPALTDEAMTKAILGTSPSDDVWRKRVKIIRELRAKLEQRRQDVVNFGSN